MVGRKCTVCAHAKAQEINKAIVRGDSYRAISHRFGVSRDATLRHRKHLAAQLFKLEEAKKLADARSLLQEVQNNSERMYKMFDAADLYLRDPEHPKRYELGPRAEDVAVTYVDQQKVGRGKKAKVLWVRKRARLSELLRRTRKPITGWYYRIADPRELFLKTALALNKQLELIGRLNGQIKDVQVPVSIAELWLRIRTVVWIATEKHPQVREAIVRLLEKQADLDESGL